MAVRKKKSKSRAKRGKRQPSGPGARLRLVLRVAARVFWLALGLQAVLIFLFAFINPPTDYYIQSEKYRLGSIRQKWIALQDMTPDMPRAVVAAEDANFCQHWGFDLAAIRSVVERKGGRLRGASTISQQVAKNVFLWPARSWIRKAFEVETTLLIEVLWSKRRIVEVYLNMVEFDTGVFGVGAAAPWYFGVTARDLSLLQAARLAAVLPNPKRHSASKPNAKTRARAVAIMDGARTIAADGRDRCFSG